MDILDVVKELLDSDEDVCLLLWRGTLESRGKLKGAEFKTTPNGNKVFNGNIVARRQITFASGDTKEFDVMMPLNAWNEDAEMLEPLQEGDRVTVVAEYNRRKTDNGYWTEGKVVAAEVAE